MSKYHFGLQGNLYEGWSLEAFHILDGDDQFENIRVIKYVWAEPKLFNGFADAIEFMVAMMNEQEIV